MLLGFACSALALLAVLLALGLLQRHWRRKRDDDDDSGRDGAHSRKRAFLKRNPTDYGYSASPAGFIDAWRARELAGAIRSAFASLLIL